MGRRTLQWVISGAFGRYLFQTNVITSGFLMGMGDFVEQKIEVARHIHPEGKFKPERVSNMTVVGFVIGAPQHYFYSYMDQYLPGNTMKVAAKKIFLDQVFGSPFFMFLFFVGLGILEHQSFKRGFNEYKQKFITVYMVDCSFWPPAQFLNFIYVKPKYRVFYINVLTAVYDIALSYMKFVLKVTDTTKSVMNNQQNKTKANKRN